MEEAYLGNGPVEIVHIDGFFSQKALAALLDIAHGSSIFVDVRYLADHGNEPRKSTRPPCAQNVSEEGENEVTARLSRVGHPDLQQAR